MASQAVSTIQKLEYDAEAATKAIELWAKARTNQEIRRRHDLERDKSAVLRHFFDFTEIHPARVSPQDVKAWQEQLKAEGKSQASIYAMVSRLSSFYEWLHKIDPMLGGINPAKAARPKAPKAYQNDSAKALTDDDASALMAAVKRHFTDKNELTRLSAMRDYAILRLMFVTGLRRTEATQLTWGNVRIGADVVTITYIAKGGDERTKEVADKEFMRALVDYLKESKRWGKMTQDAPVWSRHDKAGNLGKPCSSWALDHNSKKYAAEAGLPHFHLHQTRHTFARIVADDTGSYVDAQDALDHANANTTRIYVKKLGTKKDKHSSKIAARIK